MRHAASAEAKARRRTSRRRGSKSRSPARATPPASTITSGLRTCTRFATATPRIAPRVGDDPRRFAVSVGRRAAHRFRRNALGALRAVPRVQRPAGDRRPRSVRLDASPGAAPAQQPVHLDAGVADLSGRARHALMDPTVEDDASADPRAQRQAHEASGALPRPAAPLAVGRAVGVVVQGGGHPSGLDQQLPQRGVPPTQVWRFQHGPRVQLHRPGSARANPRHIVRKADARGRRRLPHHGGDLPGRGRGSLLGTGGGGTHRHRSAAVGTNESHDKVGAPDVHAGDPAGAGRSGHARSPSSWSTAMKAS